MTKEEKIAEVMEEVENLWAWSSADASPVVQMKQYILIESKLRELIKDDE